MGKIQANINNAIVSLKKAQANIGNVIANMKKAQANIGGVIKTIWQSAFDFYSNGIEGVGWTSSGGGSDSEATKQSNYLYMVNHGGNSCYFRSSPFDITPYNTVSFLYDAYLKKGYTKNVATLYICIKNATTDMSLTSFTVHGSVGGTTFSNEITELDTSLIEGNVVIEFELDVDGDNVSYPDGWAKIYRVWGE